MFLRASSVSDLIPTSVLKRIENHGSWDYDLERNIEMSLDDLYKSTETCLKNLGRINDSAASADSDLRLVIVPELWERLRPGSRKALRRISSTLAEYIHNSGRSLIMALSPDSRYALQEGSRLLRQRIEFAENLDTKALLEWTRFSISGAKINKSYPPEYPVYEPAFAYRLVPVLAWRVLEASEGRP